MTRTAANQLPLDAGAADGSAPGGQEDDVNICRVCRMEAGQDRPLFYPCICTGTIKYIHQDCLLQWLQVSRREYCELCGHKYKFKPIYSPDMPSRLPLADIVRSLLTSAGRGLAFWLHYTLVACSWLLLVPLLTCRLYRLLLYGGGGGGARSLVSVQGILADCCLGGVATGVSLLAYFCLVCLREAIGLAAPDWMRDDMDDQQQHGNQLVPIQNANDNANGNPDAGNNDGDIDGEEDDQDGGAGGNNHLIWELQEMLMGVFGFEQAAEPHAAGNEADEAAAPPAPDGDGAAADIAGGGAGAAAAAVADEVAVEEMNWERLLGFDGSLTFVLWLAWVLGINAMFLMLFHYLPLRIGRALVKPGALLATDVDSGGGGNNSSSGNSSSSSSGGDTGSRLPHLIDALCTLLGYAVVAAALRFGHAVMACLDSPRRYRRLLGTLYLVVKLCLLVALLLAACPLVCGLWLDLGSLRLLNATVRERRATFDSVPGAFLLVHWLLGLLWLVYSAFFFCLFVRDAFRPGLFHMPELDANFLFQLVRLPWLVTARAAVIALSFYGCLALLLLYLPAQLVCLVWPGFLPYRVAYSSESDLSFIEFLLWQVVFPAMLDQGHVKATLQAAVHRTIRMAGAAAGLSDVLFARDVAAGGAAAAAPAPAVRPPSLPRLALMCAWLAVATVFGAAVFIVCPVLIGRCLLRPFQMDSVNELYTAACGLYVCWAMLSMGHLIADWLPWNRALLLSLLRQWALLLAKMLSLGALYALVAPLLLGVLFEKVVMIPLRLPDACSPVLNLFHCWFSGLLLCKFITGCVFVGPNFRLKAALERLYEEGLARVRFGFIWRELYLPVLLFLGAPLAGPYLILRGALPLLVSDPRVLVEASRHLHFLLTTTAVALALVGYQVRQFRRFYQHLLNDRYLVGQRLVNYHPD